MDAASKLAADVNAATDAFDNLKRSLRRQFPDPVPANLPRASEHYLEVASTRQPLQLRQVTTGHALPQIPEAPLVPADLLHAAVARRLDIRAVLAGLAVSAAIGALLYLCLAAA